MRGFARERVGQVDLAAGDLEGYLKPLGAGERIAALWEFYGRELVASTSFGLQAAVMLHLIKNHAPEVPIVFVDTGYAFPETYQFAQKVIDDWGLDIRVYHPLMSAARQEALYGRQWEDGEEGMKRYALMNKVEPMNRALVEMGARVWMSGLRRSQSGTRTERGFAEQQNATMKVYPILDWADAQVEAYLREHGLPRHPLEAQGYVTMGDWHSTRKPRVGEGAEETRFGGAKYECGLHEETGRLDFQI